MTKVLLIKTTSMGDLIHTMPAVSDLAAAKPDIELHWLVEESFADVPRWHPFVRQVHTCAVRRWRRSIVNANTRQEIRQLKQRLQAEQFDLVIDAQGLVKSAWMVRWLSCTRHGYDRRSIREPLASYFYQHKHAISRQQDAISRNRQLVAASLDYILPISEADFGLQVARPEQQADRKQPYAVFLHGTNWSSKVWPVAYWRGLAQKLVAQGLDVLVAWGNEEEKQRAGQIAEGLPVTVLDRHSLNGMAYLLQQASVVVGSDTGLSHLAGALDSRTVAVYGASSAALTGLNGRFVNSLQSEKACSPCLKKNCPLVSGDEQIPCYASINDDVVMAVLNGEHA